MYPPRSPHTERIRAEAEQHEMEQHAVWNAYLTQQIITQNGLYQAIARFAGNLFGRGRQPKRSTIRPQVKVAARTEMRRAADPCGDVGGDVVPC